MGFLSEEEVTSLSISRMILHVVGGEDFEPEPEQDIANADFFKLRIIETDVAPIHSFEPKSNTKSLLEEISKDPKKFEENAQELSRIFNKDHVGTSREGAFFIFELVTPDKDVKIYSLLKFDYRDAIEQLEENGDTKLRRIIHAFIADRKAIQKCALIRVNSGVADIQVGARDRARPSPDIGDYFASFLDVKRELSNEELNSRALDAIKDTLKTHEEELPEQGIGEVIKDVKLQLSRRQTINENTLIEVTKSVFNDTTDEDKMAKILKTLGRKISSYKIKGLSFPTVVKTYKTATKRKLKTTEGIELIYPDRRDNPLVTRTKDPKGGEEIVIRTSKVVEEKILGEEISKNTQ